MSDKIAKFINGAIGGAFDSAMSSFPGVAIVWGAIKGGVGNIREKRAEKFIYFLQTNIDITYFKDEQFVDGLGITFEQYLKQRNEDKRVMIQRIFLGYITSDDKINFELERLYNLLNLLSNYHFYILKNIQNKKFIVVKNSEWNEIESNYDEIKYLQSLGLLCVEQKHSIENDIQTEERNDEHGGYSTTADSFLDIEETYSLSVFGEDFLNFIKK